MLKMFSHKNNQKGFALFYVTILVLAIIIASGINISVLTYNQQKIFQNIVKSTQAYYAAEAGLEDALLRIENGMNLSSPYNFNVGTASVTNNISDESANLKIITAEADSFGRVRKIKVNYQISTQNVSFYYGAQVGEGGMEMGNNSLVKGNIYSNGSVFGGGTIEGTIIVANNGNRIEGLNVGQDAKAHSCDSCEIGNDLTYVTGGTLSDCNVGGSILEQSEEIQSKDLPILESQINEWKQEALTGGIIEGDYIISGGTTEDLGPKKITGQLIIDNLAILNMTGTIWAVNGIRIDNGATVQMDTFSYGSLSGVLLTDGKVKIKPGTTLRGSGQLGSYLLVLSEDSETESKVDPAIDVDNNADTAIFYATQGLIVLRNNILTKEVTGYKIYLDNNAEILYESGLRDASFSSGPGASWKVTSWKEIE
jgi:Tfp pilus assembly protein PilX